MENIQRTASDRVKGNQFNAQLILSLSRQSLHASGVSTLDLNSSNPTRTTDNHLKIIISTNCCIHMVVAPDDGHRYARNM
jgi:hypothetical protein